MTDPRRYERDGGETGPKTLRDEFAMAAMQALIEPHTRGFPSEDARFAYLIADAMMLQRAKD